jgi:hypothetical protein
MGKPATPQAASSTSAQKPANKSTVTVIYRPLDVTDPNVTKWNGILFRANEPVELDSKNPAHHVTQLLPVEYPGQNGETLTKHKEQAVFMADMARSNPSFEVDGVRARRKVSTRKVPPPGAEWTEAHEGNVSESDQVDVAATRDFMAA